MTEKVFEKVNEKLLIEKLENGVEVYLYKTDKTKNFYLSISVKYGANVTKYKVNNEIIDVIPGSAHFLEHKVMALSENKEISKRINDLGSLANAWTSYYGTNYNIFGSKDIKENLRILLDLFYNTDINEKNVEEEKGIIGEEIDMYKKDKIDYLISYHLYDNLFTNSYSKKAVVGEREDIEKITAKLLNKIYNDYYSSNNTFIIVTGNFDEEEIMDLIKNYMNKLKLKPRTLPERIKEKESINVRVNYEEIKKDLENDRVKYAIKMDKRIFNIEESILRDYLGIILSNNFSQSSKLYEKYKLKGIALSLSSGINIVDDYLIITISAVSKNPDLFIKNIKKDIKKLKLTEKEFERKKKIYLKNYIEDFENIEDIEYLICVSLMKYNRIDFDDYSKTINMSYKEAKRILSLINFDNISIIKTIK